MSPPGICRVEHVSGSTEAAYFWSECPRGCYRSSGVGGLGPDRTLSLRSDKNLSVLSSQTALGLVVNDTKDQEKTVWIDDPS